jgi:hypothetical protein
MFFSLSSGQEENKGIKQRRKGEYVMTNYIHIHKILKRVDNHVSVFKNTLLSH